jgi:GxxExxY protein
MNLINLIEIVAEHLGKGYSENVYQEALCVLLRQNNINYSKENVIPKIFFDCVIGYMRADITIKELKTVIECKAINDLQESHLPQIIIYLELLKYNNGIFVNFVQNPSKPLLQIQNVTKISDDLYLFEDYYTNTNLYMNNKGIKVNIDNSKKEQEWVVNNIIYNENSILYKKECKEIYEKEFKNKNSTNFLKLIEVFCDNEFKDKQSNNQKYNKCIFNYTCK